MDWSTLPPYVIGRRAYDNALVDWAFHNAVLVDATETIKAVHQTLVDGNSAGHSSVHVDKEYNANLPGGGWDHGSTSMAHYRTVVDPMNKIAIMGRQNTTQVWPPSRPTLVISNQGKTVDIKTIPRPVFTTFGNPGYLDQLKNLICNFRQFPGMHNHLLIIVTERGMIDTLNELGYPINIAVAPSASAENGETSVYGTQVYNKLMLFRAQILLYILGETDIVWLEADAVYNQNLLERPEIVHTTSDITLFRDRFMYGGGFIRFAATSAAKSFYEEVFKRLSDSVQSGQAINDQDILNQLLREMPDLNFTVFDKCQYRSGAFLRFPEEYTDCTQPPVVQQFNWVWGLPAKVELAKAHGGWFLTLDNPTKCVKRDLRAVIMTMNRAHSFTRLFESIQQSHALIDIHVSVDVAADAIVDADVVRAIENAQVKWGERGFFTYKIHTQPIGILGNWVDSWEAELYQPDLYKAVVLLEDDLQLSPHFAKWFIGAHEMYASQDSRIGSVTGQRPQLVARGSAQFNSLSELNSAFAYKLMATWSHSPTHANWVRFRSWVKSKKADMGFKPYVDNIVPTDWYREFETKGTQDKMWEMWYIKFCELENSFTVYPWVKNGEETIACNWREKGLHYDGAESTQCDYPLLQEWDPKLLQQPTLPFYDWDIQRLQQPRATQNAKQAKRVIPAPMLEKMRVACPPHTTCHNVASDNYEALLAAEETQRTSAQNSTLYFDNAWIHPEGHISQCNNGDGVVSGGSCFNGNPPSFPCNTDLHLYKNVVVTTHYWGEGYFHFFVEGLPRLAQFAEDHPKKDIHVHIPENGASGHAAAMVGLLGYKNTVSGYVRAERVYMPPPTPCGGHVHGLHNPRLRVMLRSALHSSVANRLVLIQRQGTRRSINNHEELKNGLSKHWDVVVHTGKGTFIEQLNTFASASIAVGPHGAGLSNIMVMQAGGTILEFLPVQGPNQMNVCYMTLAHTLNLKYVADYEPTSDSSSSWNVNVDNVIVALSQPTSVQKILIHPKAKIDEFWGAGHTDDMVAIGNQCAPERCSFVSECDTTSSCLHSLDAVLFIAGIPGRVDIEARELYTQKRPRVSAVWNTEKDDDETRVAVDRELFGRRVSYSFNADIDTSQACDGMLQLRKQLLRVQVQVPDIQVPEKKGIVGVISNCGAAFRTNYIKNMMKFAHIDHYGECLRNKENTDKQRGGVSWHDTKIQLMQGYTFALAMENTKGDGYITEKIFDAYIAGAIPVYYGTEKIFRYMPRASMLYVEDFPSEEALVLHMKRIERNESLYASYFQWGLQHVNHIITKFKCDKHVLCQFCDIVSGIPQE